MIHVEDTDVNVCKCRNSLSKEFQKMRAILIDWLIGVQDTLQFSPSTLWVGISMLDRLLCVVGPQHSSLQCMGMACLMLASKIEDQQGNQLRAKQCVIISDEAFDLNQLLNMERLVVIKLNYTLRLPTVYDFVSRLTTNFSRQQTVDITNRKARQQQTKLPSPTGHFMTDTSLVLQQYYELVLFYIECLALSPDFSSFKPDAVAAVCMNRVLKSEQSCLQDDALTDTWTSIVEDITGIKEKDVLQSIIGAILEIKVSCVMHTLRHYSFHDNEIIQCNRSTSTSANINLRDSSDDEESDVITEGLLIKYSRLNTVQRLCCLHNSRS